MAAFIPIIGPLFVIRYQKCNPYREAEKDQVLLFMQLVIVNNELLPSTITLYYFLQITYLCIRF